MKKLQIICILLLFFFSISGAAYSKDRDEILISNLTETNEFTRISRYKISIIDPTKAKNPEGAYFPGYRAADQLIIYTPKFGEYTNTNEYGKEATARNNIVSDFNGANSYIPADGFVISGHGKAKKWINENIVVGAEIKIYPDSMTIESKITPESYIYKAEHRIKEVKKAILSYKKSFPDYKYHKAQKYYDEARTRFEKAKHLSSEGKHKEALKNLRSSLLLSEEAFYHVVPAVKGEFHGVWVRPEEKDRREIIRTLKQLKKSGIENIFLETYYQGYTIFPSNIMKRYGLTSQRKEFQGWDPLQCWIEEAHKRNMKIHVWFQVFYAGNEDVTKTPGHILFVYPEWANIQRKNAGKKTPQPSASEHNGYFLDPANHMVQKFLLELIVESASKYNIDGLNIDYIRYPKSLSYKFPGYVDSTWGYTDYARDEFKKRYGKDPLNISTSHSLWSKWMQYRQDKVTDFVSKLKPILKPMNIEVSAVVFPNIKDTRITKLQDWPKWAQKSYFDAFTPLIMSSDRHRANLSVQNLKKIIGNNAKIYPGLFEPFTSGTPINLLHQIRGVREAGASGVVIFDKAHLDNDFMDALRARAFND